MIRRGRKNKCKSVTNFVLLHSNIRGLRSKVQSLNHVVNNILSVDCISLNEHGIRGRNSVKIDNFHSFSKNRMNKRMGGVSLSIPNDKINSFMKVKEGDDSDEYMIIRNDEVRPALNIVTFYGESESRTSKEDLSERWGRLLLDLDKIELRNEHVVIASDINRKLGNDSLGIKGNSEEVSYGGSLVRELIASGKYLFVNNTRFVEGGPNTRIDPADPSKKSVLDVIIISKSL